MKRLLLVSPFVHDDAALRVSIAEHGYEVRTYSCDAYAHSPLGVDDGDLVVVDLARSGVGWFADLERRRRHTRSIAVLVLLRGGDAEERIDALDAGADDCLSRPFDCEEFRARLDALMRRHRQPTIRLGTFLWHWTHRQASIDSVPLMLSPYETSLLEELLKSPGRIVPKSVLSRRIERSDSSATLNRLYVYICRLRKKLMTAQLVIRSASGLGYALDTSGIGIERKPKKLSTATDA